MLKLTTTVRTYAKQNNLKIVEAPHGIKLNLTAADVRRGESKNPESCGFARCCTRTHKVEKAFFLRSTAYLQKDKKLVRYVLPTRMTKEIIAFDRGGKMQPGLYTLSKASPGQTRAHMSKAWDARKHGKSGPSGKRHKTLGIRTGIVVAA